MTWALVRADLDRWLAPLCAPGSRRHTTETFVGLIDFWRPGAVTRVTMRGLRVR
jgi:hypothetical protein